jgi:hypothetical protein
MNVLFLTLVGFESLQERGIYTDLLREFVKNGHTVYAISPVEKSKGKESKPGSSAKRRRLTEEGEAYFCAR